MKESFTGQKHELPTEDTQRGEELPDLKEEGNQKNI